MDPTRLAQAIAQDLELVGPVSQLKDGHWLSFSVDGTWVRSGNCDMAAVAERELAAAKVAEGLVSAPQSGIIRHSGALAGKISVLWQKLDSRRPAQWADMSRCLAALSTIDPGDLADYSAVEDVHRWTAHGVQHGLLDDGDSAVISDIARSAARALSAERWGLIHGDAHLGNMIATHDRTYLVDLETMSRGPLIYDWAPAMVEANRFGADEQEVSHAIDCWRGLTGHSTAGLDAAVALYETWVVAWCVKHAIAVPSCSAEMRVRLDGLLAGKHGRWTRQ